MIQEEIQILGPVDQKSAEHDKDLLKENPMDGSGGPNPGQSQDDKNSKEAGSGTGSATEDASGNAEDKKAAVVGALFGKKEPVMPFGRGKAKAKGGQIAGAKPGKAGGAAFGKSKAKAAAGGVGGNNANLTVNTGGAGGGLGTSGGQVKMSPRGDGQTGAPGTLGGAAPGTGGAANKGGGVAQQTSSGGKDGSTSKQGKNKSDRRSSGGKGSSSRRKKSGSGGADDDNEDGKNKESDISYVKTSPPHSQAGNLATQIQKFWEPRMTSCSP